MPTIYLIHGLPGSGKTVFARRLAAETGAVLLNHDAIRTAVFGFDPPKEGFEECTARIHELIWTLTEKFVGHGVDVILDHGFWSRAERDEARVRSRSFGADPRFYRMVCPDAMADARVLKRNEAAESGTLYVPPGALDVFRARFQPMGADEESIPIRTDLFNKSVDLAALAGTSAAGQPPDATSGRESSSSVAQRPMTIRTALVSDATDIATLTTQLGYAADAVVVAGRLAKLSGLRDHIVLVAVLEEKIVGWLHAHASEALESGLRAEIVGLVVSEGHRRWGVGRVLVQHAEQWARDIGAETIVVRSNTNRVESHSFYPALSYSLSKTQAVYRKLLKKALTTPLPTPTDGTSATCAPGTAGISTYQKMDATFTEDLSAIDWVRLARVFELAPLGVRDPVKLRETFTNSSVRCFAWHEGELIGAGRAISDGIAYAAIFDVVLLPEYQGKGIGRQIMTFLAERSKAGNIILHSVPGKEEFYRKLGFCRMKTAMGRFANPERQRLFGYIE